MWRSLVHRDIRIVFVRQVFHDMQESLSVRQNLSLQHIDLRLLPRDNIIELAQQILLKGKLRLQIEQLFEQLFRVRFLAHSLTVDAFERVPIKTDRITT